MFYPEVTKAQSPRLPAVGEPGPKLLEAEQIKSGLLSDRQRGCDS